jgi:nitronate monooxygenase
LGYSNGLVFHDVTNLEHAAKAVAAGVDGLIAVCAGAGGHAGLASPLALVPQLRKRFADKTIIAAGAISDGATVRAVQTLGADLAYMGTRFIATVEADASDDYKNMIVNAKNAARNARPTYLPIVYTDRISGVHANFLRESLTSVGLDPSKLENQPPVTEDFSKLGM